jgi:hypothetical protein
MMDAYTHLDMSVRDPIGDLALRMDAAQVDRALIVETWGKDNRACLERLIASPSQRFRVALCFRPEEGGLSPEVLHLETVRALRIRTADIQALGALAKTLESSGKWLLPHAESGIQALKNELLLLAARHPKLRIYLPHLGWPRRDRQNDEDWWDSLSELSSLRNLVVGISAIAHFSRKAFPHKDIEPFAATLREAFGPEKLAAASDYPLFEKNKYSKYMRLAGDWIHGGSESGSRLESSLFGGLADR